MLAFDTQFVWTELLNWPLKGPLARAEVHEKFQWREKVWGILGWGGQPSACMTNPRSASRRPVEREAVPRVGCEDTLNATLALDQVWPRMRKRRLPTLQYRTQIALGQWGLMRTQQTLDNARMGARGTPWESATRTDISFPREDLWVALRINVDGDSIRWAEAVHTWAMGESDRDALHGLSGFQGRALCTGLKSSPYRCGSPSL